jgi:uncharacterized peroxidase-related enzyme
MARIQPIALESASPAVQPQLSGLQQKLGRVPNLLRTLAHSPAALDAYLGFSGALAKAALTPAERESIALAVAGENACGYCAAAHTAIGASQKIDPAELAKNLRGASASSRTQALLSLATAIVAQRGQVSAAQLADFRAAGLGDQELVELIAVVSLNLFTNYFNHVVDTQIDFPVVALPKPATVAR